MSAGWRLSTSEFPHDAGAKSPFPKKGKAPKTDKNLNKSLSDIGGKGLFIKELEYFILNGEVGVQEVYAYDADGLDVSDGLWVFGLEAGPSTTLFFPILVDISRFENAMYDLMDECPGIKSKY